MTGPCDRRAFLRGLTTLPLIGGGVTLIGTPSAVAEPISAALLNSYSQWLFDERRALCRERFPGEARPWAFVPGDTGAENYHFPPPCSGIDWRTLPPPSSRAALVLSAVGCDWRVGDGA